MLPSRKSEYVPKSVSLTEWTICEMDGSTMDNSAMPGPKNGSNGTHVTLMDELIMPDGGTVTTMPDGGLMKFTTGPDAFVPYMDELTTTLHPEDGCNEGVSVERSNVALPKLGTEPSGMVTFILAKLIITGTELFGLDGVQLTKKL